MTVAQCPNCGAIVPDFTPPQCRACHVEAWLAGRPRGTR